jgi:tRNA U34 5-carboxymethylaminomethyl modifying GTPase MnmE/TrmE
VVDALARFDQLVPVPQPAAGVSYANKIDKADADPDRVLAQLAELGVTTEAWGGNVPLAKVSAKTGDGVDALLAQLKGLLASEAVREASGPVLVTSLRHRQCLERAAQALGRALALRGDDWMEECLAVELHSALDAFGEIVGETVSEDVLGEIFSKFCIGK